MYVIPEHEPHEGDDYVTYDPATVCQYPKANLADPRAYRCYSESVAMLDGRRACAVHVESPEYGTAVGSSRRSTDPNPDRRFA